MQVQLRPHAPVDMAIDLPPLAQRILSARGITEAGQLAFTLKDMHPIRDLADVTQAAQLLADAIEAKQNILIVGDYDVDGATATALSVRVLRMMGHEAVDFLVPDRFKYGYGLTPEIVTLAQQYEPDVIMTVDNGVSSHEGVEAAKALGWKTLITDHHLPGRTLPDCDVMVNPNRQDDDFPSKALAGVGVAFYVMMALKNELARRAYFVRYSIPELNLLKVLDLVALGTVADVVPLDANNRILVEQGLRRIRAGQVQPGIKALLQMGGKDYRQCVSSDFGFVCGPRLNAAGRLSDMSIGIRCLLSDSESETRQLAQQLDELNGERKRIEGEMKQEAEAIIRTLVFESEQNTSMPPVMCMHQADWHEGVIGILASRIKERYYRPVIIFASGEEGVIKGSGRSIPGLHMRDLIDEVAGQYPGLILRFGGHAMAAGLTLKAEHLEIFSQAMTVAVVRQLQPDSFNEVVYTDGKLAQEDMTLDRAEQLRFLAPWGQHFPEPQFEGVFEIRDLRVLKEAHMKAVLAPVFADTLGEPVNAIDFFADLEQWPAVGEQVRLIYRLSVNEFRGERSLQLMVEWVLPA